MSKSSHLFPTVYVALKPRFHGIPLFRSFSAISRTRALTVPIYKRIFSRFLSVLSPALHELDTHVQGGHKGQRSTSEIGSNVQAALAAAFDFGLR